MNKNFFTAALAASLLWLPNFSKKTVPPDGEALAQKYCAACHAYPEPALLDRKTWQKIILPRMGFMAGVLSEDSVGGNFIEAAARSEAFQNPRIFRKQPIMSKSEWAAVRDFYLKNAPEKLPAPAFAPLLDSSKIFRPIFPEYAFSPPGTTLVDLETGSLTIGDAQQKRVFFFDKNLKIKKLAVSPEGAVSRHALPEGDILTCMGSFSPTDRTAGQVLFFPKNDAPPLVLLDSLRRPVHTAVGDLDGDGLFDLVVSEFGKWTGGLSWWRNRGDGRFDRRLLYPMPGGIRTALTDLDGDGRTDIVALFAQGDERILAFLNRGGGRFDLEPLLEFPPSFGSSFFVLTDFDADGDADILYACGDNADYPPIVKPYHGIRIFENRGQNQFFEKIFLPLPGAYGAVAADFDLDGDVDVAAVSFFPNYREQPEAGFIFFENSGGDAFVPHTFSFGKKGRWLVLDAADFDSDGDLDLCLGSLAFENHEMPALLDEWVREALPFLILENTRF